MWLQKPLLAVLSLQSVCHGWSEDTRVRHANHIFNAVNSAMRQWGSSINHNGMTAFIATVPQDTEFYHGTLERYRINGTQWLAFEPEHALVFARPQEESPRRRPHQTAGRLNQLMNTVAEARQPSFPPRPKQAQHPFGHAEPTHGYLHTYRTNKSLRLLYLDGQSAAKSTKGTLDLQDTVILRNGLSHMPHGGSRHSGPMQEHERAKLLCNRASSQWQGKIHGILRMEAGFEIILCSFAQHLDVVSIKRVQSDPPRLPTEDYTSISDLHSINTRLNYYKAVSARYDGIGGGRVSLNFDTFASLFNTSESFYIDQHDLPRAKNDSASLDLVRKQIDILAASDVRATVSSTDWQAITDMVVSRYADRIANLASDDADELGDLQIYLTMALQPFMDIHNRDPDLALRQCSRQFLPSHLPQTLHDLPLAAAAILNVTSTICEALLQASRMRDASAIKQSMRHLRRWLAWPIWKRCRGCATDEVCFVPMWPIGGLADFEQPRCKTAVDLRDVPRDYWDDWS